MRISEAFPSKYISAADLQGKPARVIMGDIQMEKVGDDTKPVLYFEGKEKGLVLNKTNANAIAYAYGDDTVDWRGGEVELFTVMTDFQGKPVEAVRVRIPPRRPAPPANARGNVEKPFPGDSENPAF